MTLINSQNSELNKLLRAKFNLWFCDPKNSIRIDNLSESESWALFHLLEAEISKSNTYHLRAERFHELYAFNYDLNLIASELIQNLIMENTLFEFKFCDGGFLDISLQDSLFNDGVSKLKNNGYWISPLTLSNDQVHQILDCLKNYEFISYTLPPQVLSGSELLNFVRNNEHPIQRFGDTYWMQNQNEIVHSQLFNRLAFDPFILSIANGYLGCPPIHDQINVWFSFPSKMEKGNLSSNAQLFHQDKDWIKFLKVFIYLTDVDEKNGPHSYVEGTHRDPISNKGIPLHTRVEDNLVESVYGADRIKTILGKAGTIVFADTSCVHKGSPLISASRLILQLEYTTSLYLSQISPFTNLDIDKVYRPPVSDRFFERVTANYCSKNREIFGMFHSKVT